MRVIRTDESLPAIIRRHVLINHVALIGYKNYDDKIISDEKCHATNPLLLAIPDAPPSQCYLDAPAVAP